MTCDLAIVKCVVINLPRAKARLQAIAGQFNQLNIDFETLEATDWRDLNEQDYKNVDHDARDREGRRALSPGMVACHLSHRRAIADVASGEPDLTAIFEDDVVLAANIGTVLRTLQEAYSAGSDFDLVFLHRNKTYLQFVVLETIDENVKLGITKYSDWGAHGYVISKTAAGKLLSRYPRIVHRCDHTLHAHWESGLNVFSLHEPVVSHGNDAGDHSFLQEGSHQRVHWSVPKLPRRAASILREEVLKRRYFRQKLKKAKLAT
ncbi:MAG: glycosyltransferase family 25 protein [Rhodospirillales bacterium]|nr:glycosyltransferase family 25 protein [Rhodospirillales bacterium]